MTCALFLLPPVSFLICRAPMFSLHIDTARTWRGGQSQGFYTVTGLRARRQRAVLVAPPDGELYRRMQQGGDLIPLATRSEVDLSSAWRLSPLLRKLRPDVVQAPGPPCVAV